MPISEAAYLKVGLGFIPEDIKNEMKEKREDVTESWRLSERDEREPVEVSEQPESRGGLTEAEIMQMGLELMPGQTRARHSLRESVEVEEEDEYVESSQASLALAALEAHGFVERSVKRRPTGAEHQKNVRAYRANKTKEKRRKRNPAAKRKAKIARMKHDRAFQGRPAKKGFIRYR